jgi:hypothetical protein
MLCVGVEDPEVCRLLPPVLLLFNSGIEDVADGGRRMVTFVLVGREMKPEWIPTDKVDARTLREATRSSQMVTTGAWSDPARYETLYMKRKEDAIDEKPQNVNFKGGRHNHSFYTNLIGSTQTTKSFGK